LAAASAGRGESQPVFHFVQKSLPNELVHSFLSPGIAWYHDDADDHAVDLAEDADDAHDDGENAHMFVPLVSGTEVSE